MKKIFCAPKRYGKRQQGASRCNKKCKFWYDCWKHELGLSKSPKGFKEVPVDKWNLMLDNWHYNWNKEKMVWVMRKKSV